MMAEVRDPATIPTRQRLDSYRVTWNGLHDGFGQQVSSMELQISQLKMNLQGLVKSVAKWRDMPPPQKPVFDYLLAPAVPLGLAGAAETFSAMPAEPGSAKPVAALASPESEGESAGASTARSSHFVSINSVTTSMDQCLLNPLRTWLLALESARERLGELRSNRRRYDAARNAVLRARLHEQGHTPSRKERQQAVCISQFEAREKQLQDHLRWLSDQAGRLQQHLLLCTSEFGAAAQHYRADSAAHLLPFPIELLETPSPQERGVGTGVAALGTPVPPLLKQPAAQTSQPTSQAPTEASQEAGGKEEEQPLLSSDPCPTSDAATTAAPVTPFDNTTPVLDAAMPQDLRQEAQLSAQQDEQGFRQESFPALRKDVAAPPAGEELKQAGEKGGEETTPPPRAASPVSGNAWASLFSGLLRAVKGRNNSIDASASPHAGPTDRPIAGNTAKRNSISDSGVYGQEDTTGLQGNAAGPRSYKSAVAAAVPPVEKTMPSSNSLEGVPELHPVVVPVSHEQDSSEVAAQKVAVCMPKTEVKSPNCHNYLGYDKDDEWECAVVTRSTILERQKSAE